jgi:hypothetical protein
MASATLPFGLKYRRLPYKLIHSFYLRGSNLPKMLNEIPYRPNNIIARFGKPKLCYEVVIDLHEFNQSWGLELKYNCSVTPSLATRDITLWLETVISDYCKTPPIPY